MATVRDAEIIAALEDVLRAQADPEGYYTCDELCGLLGPGRVMVQRRLQVAKRAGRLDVVRVKRESLDGRMMHTPAYRIVP